jgi:hypothetical protein
LLVNYQTRTYKELMRVLPLINNTAPNAGFRPAPQGVAVGGYGQAPGYMPPQQPVYQAPPQPVYQAPPQPGYQQQAKGPNNQQFNNPY